MKWNRLRERSLQKRGDKRWKKYSTNRPVCGQNTIHNYILWKLLPPSCPPFYINLHCCIKCPQILREKTSSQNSQGIALRIQWYFFSSKLDGIKKYFCRQYLQNLNALIFWFKYLQKVNAMPSDFWWKKKFCPFDK